MSNGYSPSTDSYFMKVGIFDSGSNQQLLVRDLGISYKTTQLSPTKLNHNQWARAGGNLCERIVNRHDWAAPTRGVVIFCSVACRSLLVLLTFYKVGCRHLTRA